MPERFRRWKTLLNIHDPVFVIGLLLFITILALLYTTVSLRHVAGDLRDEQSARLTIAQQNQDILREIRSCTTPEGECTKRGAENGANLIAASIVCTNRNVQTKAEALKCVAEVLQP